MIGLSAESDDHSKLVQKQIGGDCASWDGWPMKLMFALLAENLKIELTNRLPILLAIFVHSHFSMINTR